MLRRFRIKKPLDRRSLIFRSSNLLDFSKDHTISGENQLLLSLIDISLILPFNFTISISDENLYLISQHLFFQMMPLKIPYDISEYKCQETASFMHTILRYLRGDTAF